MADDLTRRQFVQRGAAAAAVAAGSGLADTAGAGKAPKQDTSKILNYNSDMEYRRLGKTGLMISAVVLGGHWKRVVKVIGGSEPRGWMSMAIDNKNFQKNRHDVLSRCIERGFNYVDACCREEILAYARALKGRRDKMYFGYSWHIWESRFKEWRSAKKLQAGLEKGMKEAGLKYVYLGNVPHGEYENTFCPGCGELLIERIGFSTRSHYAKDGKCPKCGITVPLVE